METYVGELNNFTINFPIIFVLFLKIMYLLYIHMYVIYTVAYYSAIKRMEWYSAICNNVDLPRGYYA